MVGINSGISSSNSCDSRFSICFFEESDIDLERVLEIVLERVLERVLDKELELNFVLDRVLIRLLFELELEFDGVLE